MSVPADGGEKEERRHQVWKKNAPYQYDVIMTKELAWPTLTVEWMPERRYDAEKECHVHRLLMGTHTDGEEVNHVIITDVVLPPQPDQLNMKRYDPLTEEVGGYGQTDARIAIKSEIGADGESHDKARIMLVHEAEVLAARCCPRNPNVVATKPGQSSDVLMFDLRQHFWDPKQSTECKPNLRLQNGRHDGEGSALAWSPFTEAVLASSGSDGVVDVWDLAQDEAQSSRQLMGHSALVEDVAFHCHDRHVLGSASDDKTAAVWDMRQREGPSLWLVGHQDEVNSISFSPWNPVAAATGSSDTSIALWDLRQARDPLLRLQFHTQPVYRVRFAPFHETVVASSSLDGRVLLWDLAQAGSPACPGRPPPELVFIHDGHGAPVTDFGWNCSAGDEWLMASASDNNLLHVWRMADSLYGDH